jgi:hypothetical protein
MKSMKIDEDKRVFVGEKKKDPATKEEKKALSEPAVFVLIKLKLPQHKK